MTHLNLATTFRLVQGFNHRDTFVIDDVTFARQRTERAPGIAQRCKVRTRGTHEVPGHKCGATDVQQASDTWLCDEPPWPMQMTLPEESKPTPTYVAHRAEPDGRAQSDAPMVPQVLLLKLTCR